MEQIIAIGGGGFSMEPANLALDRYVLEQTGKPRPAICFLPTAAGDSSDLTVKFFSAFSQIECRPSYLSLFGSIPADLESFVLEHDVVYVSGGRTRNMLALWREWGLVKTLRKALEEGVILSGVSAGGVCWFQQAITKTSGSLGILECLGFLGGSCCPHYDSQAERRSFYHQSIAQGDILPGFGLDDGVALHFVDGELQRIVRSRPEAQAYVVEIISGVVTERLLESISLLDVQSS